MSSDSSNTSVLTHIFKHPWQNVSLASWMKYPCERRPDVLSVDLLDRHYDKETGLLHSTRLVTTSFAQVPSWMKPMLPGLECYALEESVVDPKNKKMVLNLRNISYSNLIELRETCTYTADERNEHWTRFKQEATSAAFTFAFRSNIEQWAIDTFSKNAVVGREIMESAINKVEESWSDLASQFCSSEAAEDL